MKLLILIPLLLLLVSCDADKAPEGVTSNRLQIIDQTSWTQVVRDTKTECEFIFLWGDGRAIALIPHTCKGDK